MPTLTDERAMAAIGDLQLSRVQNANRKVLSDPTVRNIVAA